MIRETELSRFFRKAKSSEKKKVYKKVLEKATERQERLLEGD